MEGWGQNLSALTMKEYDLFVPTRESSGRAIGKTRLVRLRKVLVGKFGGLTQFPQKQTGFWKVGSVTFRDNITIWRVLSDEDGKDAVFWKKLKQNLSKEWGQDEILIVMRKVKII